MNDTHTPKNLLRLLGHVEGWLSNHEALLLYHLAQKIPVSGDIVEIGSYKGKSTIALAEGMKHSSKHAVVWAIDPHEGVIKSDSGATHGATFTAFQKNIKLAQLESFVQPLLSTSKKAAKNWKNPIRLLFLDGLHDFAHTHEDYQLWSGHVVKGGCIAFHDAFCGEEGVWKVINSYVFKRKDIVDIGTAGSILYIFTGKPTVRSTLRVKRKKQFVRLAISMNRKKIPWVVKKVFIHTCIRFILLTRYTRSIYTR